MALGSTEAPPSANAAAMPVALAAWLECAFSSLGILEVVALAEPANVASLHVLEKLGMRRAGERIAFGRPHVVFRTQRALSTAPIPSKAR